MCLLTIQDSRQKDIMQIERSINKTTILNKFIRTHQIYTLLVLIKIVYIVHYISNNLTYVFLIDFKSISIKKRTI